MELQRELSGRAVWRADFGFRGALRVLACDVSYSKATNLCYGAAVVGGYRDYFDDEQIDQIDTLVRTELSPQYGYNSKAGAAL